MHELQEDIVVLVTKLPARGLSKTRMGPMLHDNAWLLSQAMLQDTIHNLLVMHS